MGRMSTTGIFLRGLTSVAPGNDPDIRDVRHKRKYKFVLDVPKKVRTDPHPPVHPSFYSAEEAAELTVGTALMAASKARQWSEAIVYTVGEDSLQVKWTKFPRSAATTIDFSEAYTRLSKCSTPEEAYELVNQIPTEAEQVQPQPEREKTRAGHPAEQLQADGPEKQVQAEQFQAEAKVMPAARTGRRAAAEAGRPESSVAGAVGEKEALRPGGRVVPDEVPLDKKNKKSPVVGSRSKGNKRSEVTAAPPPEPGSKDSKDSRDDAEGHNEEFYSPSEVRMLQKGALLMAADKKGFWAAATVHKMHQDAVSVKWPKHPKSQPTKIPFADAPTRLSKCSSPQMALDAFERVYAAPKEGGMEAGNGEDEAKRYDSADEELLNDSFYNPEEARSLPKGKILMAADKKKQWAAASIFKVDLENDVICVKWQKFPKSAVTKIPCQDSTTRLSKCATPEEANEVSAHFQQLLFGSG